MDFTAALHITHYSRARYHAAAQRRPQQRIFEFIDPVRKRFEIYHEILNSKDYIYKVLQIKYLNHDFQVCYKIQPKCVEGITLKRTTKRDDLQFAIKKLQQLCFTTSHE